MPLTFPSHAAAVLPLCRAGGWLPPSALIVGSTAPDLAYLFDTNLNFHLWPALAWPCLLVAFVSWVVFEEALLPWLAALLAEVWSVEASRLAVTRGSPRDVRGVLAALVALTAGALTHIAWDGFTHANRWPASVLYHGVEVGPLFLNQWLQLASHVVGLVIVVAAALRLTPGVRWTQPRWTPALKRLLLSVTVGVATGLAALLIVRPELKRGVLFGGAWLAFWWSARGAMATLLVFGLAFRASANGHRRGVSQAPRPAEGSSGR
jgi:Domain of unknown function (DUF4184)